MILRIIFLVMMLWAVYTTIQQMILLIKEAGLNDCVKNKKNILTYFTHVNWCNHFKEILIVLYSE